MFKLYRSTFYFSIKGIVSLSPFLVFLAWLLRDYPEWRSKRIKSLGDESAIVVETASQQQEETNDQDKQQVQQQNDQNITATGESKNNSHTKEANLSIAHYILVTPFAAFYIIARAILDIIRFSLYFIIWSCEISLPYIDDWLFDKVTIWIPEKYNKLEKWWIEKGQPSFVSYKTQFQQITLPAIIENMELFFTKSYEIKCVVQASMQKFIAAWKTFIKRHDWRQLSQDLGDVVYMVIWSPTVWIVTRSIRLGKLVYSGLRSTAISIKNDIVWISTIAIPTSYNYIISTQLAKYSFVCASKLSNTTQSVCIHINNYLLAPTLGRLLTWTVQGIDKLILLLQTNTFQQRLRRIYCWISPNMVWAIIEFSSLVIHISKWAHLLFSQLFLPAYNLFMVYVKPQLASAYQGIIVKWLFEAHIIPAWLKLYPYLNVPVHYIYNNIISPISSQLYIAISALYQYVTQQLLVQLQAILTKVNQFTMVYTQWVYSHIQSWLIRQAPILLNMIQKLYEFIVNSCDWNQLQQDTWTVVTTLYNWIAEQSNMIYLSLERSLSSWTKEQQEQNGGVPLKEKLL